MWHAMETRMRTQVATNGAGPAGLLLGQGWARTIADNYAGPPLEFAE